jgi:hypothetical protein
LGILGLRALDMGQYHPDKTCKGYPYIIKVSMQKLREIAAL